MHSWDPDELYVPAPQISHWSSLLFDNLNFPAGQAWHDDPEFTYPSMQRQLATSSFPSGELDRLGHEEHVSEASVELYFPSSQLVQVSGSDPATDL